jgi:cation diffusion facilitator CzcD-associated flavoprotein CzcO
MAEVTHEVTHYDAIILGSGQAGTPLATAWQRRASGQR